MDGTIVFIFLLDHLPETILNKTLETVEVTHTQYSGINQCDYRITDPLLQVISRELEVLMIPKWLVDERRNNGSKRNNFNKTSYATFVKTNTVVESSVSTEHKTEGNKLIIEHALDKTEHLNKDADDEGEEIKAPLMAAIFESLSNVTAQTCGGTVVAPQWVLTAASCVNLLSTLNAETNNTTEKSVYTVIINATDPLIDGSAHNVTEILVHPNNETHDVITKRIGKKAVVALMKIEPALGIDEIPVLITREDSTQHVRVYGWTMNKTVPDHDTMRQTSFEALILTPQDCSTHYNITEDTSEMCMATSDEYVDLSQLSWGGPVMSHKGGIVGVSRGDSHAPLAAWPLVAHIDWVHATALH